MKKTERCHFVERGFFWVKFEEAVRLYSDISSNYNNQYTLIDPRTRASGFSMPLNVFFSFPFRKMQHFPENTMVVTQLRDPVTRVISLYEFGIEVAARKIHLDDDTVLQEALSKPEIVNTNNVWPWSVLVRWFRNDIRARMAKLEEEARKPGGRRPTWIEQMDKNTNKTYWWNPKTKKSEWTRPTPTPSLDPYNNPLVMPLEEWIETDIAKDIAQEAQAVQLLGISNYSFWEDAKELRECFFEDPASKERLGKLAVERLRNSGHAGLTERLDESVSALAATLKIKMDSTAYKSVPPHAFSYDTEEEDSKTFEAKFKRIKPPVTGAPTTMSYADAKRFRFSLESQVEAVKRNITSQKQMEHKLLKEENEWLEDHPESREQANGFWGSIKEKIVTSLGGTLPPSSPFYEKISAIRTAIKKTEKVLAEIQHDLDKLKKIPKLKPAVYHQHRARLLLPEKMFAEPEPLGMAYRKCEDTSIQKSKMRRDASFGTMHTPWFETLKFSSEKRAQISESIIDRIKVLNKIDIAVYEEGKKLLEQEIRKHKENGVFEELPPKKIRSRGGPQLDSNNRGLLNNALLQKQQDGKLGPQMMDPKRLEALQALKAKKPNMHLEEL